MNEPRLTPMAARAYYGKKLQAEIVEYNDALEQVHNARAELSADADRLRSDLVAGKRGKPETTPATVAALIGRRIALDVRELALCGRKSEFKKPVLGARATERDRLAGLEKKRRDEIAAKLKEIETNSPFVPGIINGDETVRTLAAQRAAVSGFENCVTGADEARAEFLQARLAAVVPAL